MFVRRRRTHPKSSVQLRRRAGRGLWLSAEEPEATIVGSEERAGGSGECGTKQPEATIVGSEERAGGRRRPASRFASYPDID